MKAWYVTPYEDQEYGDIVWADTRGKARAKGAQEFCDYSLIVIRALRVPAADGLSPRSITPRWWLEHDYWVPCDGCGTEIYGITAELVFLSDNQIVYCGTNCQECTRQRRYDRLERHEGYLYREAEMDIV